MPVLYFSSPCMHGIRGPGHVAFTNAWHCVVFHLPNAFVKFPGLKRELQARDVRRPDEDPDQNPDIKTILLTNILRSNLEQQLQMGCSVFHTCNCSERRCQLTQDKTKFGMADAVVFDGYGGGFNNRAPARKFINRRVRSDKIFVFHNMEAPIRHSGQIKDFYHHDFFNLTMTYRQDSNIRVPYWRLSKRTETKLSSGINLHEVRKKSRTAVWFISHCERYGSQRWTYVEQLRKYIDVDIYGDCGNFSCPRNFSDYNMELNCFRDVSKTYYFYLALENAFCKDYLTEKILHAWLNQMVPVVQGSFDNVLPPYSALDVRDYANPRELAEKMKSLREDSTEYMKYFEFKRYYDVHGPGCDRGFCRLCEILHDPSYQYKSRFDVRRWWTGQGQCQTEEEVGRVLGLN